MPYTGSAPVTGGPPGLEGQVVAGRSVPFLLIDARFDAEYNLTLRNWVVREAAAGTLDFYYQVTNDSHRPLRLIDMDTGAFTRPDSFDPIDAGYRDDGASRYGPLRADRGRSHFNGVVLQFPFFQTLDPGQGSQPFFVRTGATRFELAGLTQFRSTPGASVQSGFAVTFSPVLDGPIVPPPAVAEVPLPAAGWWGACGLASFLLGSRRRAGHLNPRRRCRL